jgi:serine protease Do
MAPWWKLLPWRSLQAVCFTVLLVGLAAAPAPSTGADTPSPAEKPVPLPPKEVPENVEDLKALQKQVKAVLEKVVPCTVGLRIGASQGSGVIINKEGYVLTAGHVSGTPNREVTVILHNGKTVKGKTLGANVAIDSGLVQITDKGDWPFVEMGNSAELKPGQWCIAVGHPGGYRPGRSPVVRVGRVLVHNSLFINSDCTLVGGDSGGPLFDLHGKVIGIHSRIGGPITANVHVPVDTYRETWDRLAKGEVFGGRSPGGAFLGIQGDPESRECKIVEIVPDSPAAKAGLRAEDVILAFDGQKVGRYEDLVNLILKKKPGDEVVVEVRRGDATLSLQVTLGKR